MNCKICDDIIIQENPRGFVRCGQDINGKLYPKLGWSFHIDNYYICNIEPSQCFIQLISNVKGSYKFYSFKILKIHIPRSITKDRLERIFLLA